MVDGLADKAKPDAHEAADQIYEPGEWPQIVDQRGLCPHRVVFMPLNQLAPAATTQAL